MSAVANETGVEISLWPWGVLIIAVGLYALAVAAVLAAGRREDARALAGFIPDCIVLVGRLARVEMVVPVDQQLALERAAGVGRRLVLGMVGIVGIVGTHVVYLSDLTPRPGCEGRGRRT